MTNFYTYQYLTRQPNKVNTVIWITSIVLVVGALFFAVLFVKHRDDGKYRDLTIIMILGLLLTITIQYSQWSKRQTSQTHNGEVVALIKQVAQQEHIKTDQISSNSTDLHDGMLLRLKNGQIYKVGLNSDNSSFTLQTAHLTNPKIKLLR